ncbi:DedA family protein [Marimonas lutisalis]|uniref:DedA family protein n=1 Tax=Marimonas lutisalis TaxID=2545756 RepID=UPI0010F6BBA7|nr:DedA family protein [Marimonas lutisalis]
MNDWLLPLLVSYGLPLVFLATLLSCLALPVPSSLVMLTAGAFSATGELSLLPTVLAAFTGAVIGDQIGYFIGSTGQSRLATYIDAHPKRAALLARAVGFLRRHGGPGVFFSRWLVSPLGPYVNFAAGAAALRWPRFALWGASGELVWVALYVGLGFAFSENLAAVAEFASDISGILAGLAVMLGSGLWLRHALHETRKQQG